jgi:hypothetical protein
LTTFLYVIGGWILFNVVVAVGMYFRPVRKKKPDSPNTAPLREPTERSSDDASSGSPPRDAVAEYGKPLPASLTRLLFFGYWLNDRVRTRAAVEREPT